MTQTSVADAPEVAFAGLMGDSGLHKKYTGNAQVAVPYGRFLVPGTDPTRQVKLPASAAEVRKGIGFAVAKAMRGYVAGGYEIGEELPVLRLGSVWVETEGAVTAWEQVYIRHTANGGNTALGKVRGNSDSGNCEPLLGCRFLTTLSGAGLAKVEFFAATPPSLVVEDLTIADDIAVTGDIQSGDMLDAVTGMRTNLAGFAKTMAADQTNVDFDRFGITGGAWVAPMDGSIVGLSALLSTAVTGSSKTATVKVTINGTEIGGSGVAFTSGGAEVKGQATYAKGTYAFVAGDKIGVSYTSNTITSTPVAVGDVLVEM